MLHGLWTTIPSYFHIVSYASSSTWSSASANTITVLINSKSHGSQDGMSSLSNSLTNVSHDIYRPILLDSKRRKTRLATHHGRSFFLSDSTEASNRSTRSPAALMHLASVQPHDLGPQMPRRSWTHLQELNTSTQLWRGVVHARGEPRRRPSTALPLSWMCVL